jgi:hypothetical protein
MSIADASQCGTTCHAGMIHHFYAMGGVIHARTAIAEIGAGIRSALA